MIELQPRGLGGDAMLLKVNEIIMKFNALDERCEKAFTQASGYFEELAETINKNADAGIMVHAKVNALEGRIAYLENTIRGGTKVVKPDDWDAAMASLNAAVSMLGKLAEENAR